jgi:hypothetical protein
MRPERMAMGAPPICYLMAHEPDGDGKLLFDTGRVCGCLL